MHRIGILSVAAPGHFYPISALGRRLRSRGREVVYFQVADFERRARGAGLEYHPIGEEDFPVGSIRARDEELGRLKGIEGLRFVVRRLVQSSRMILRDAPDAIRKERIDALIVDQCTPAGGAVADFLGLPFVSVAACVPINLDAGVPPYFTSWPHRPGPASRLRNRLGNGLGGRLTAPVMRAVDDQRRSWGLPPARGMGGTFSKLAQVAQLPAALELPGRRLPPGFHHTGPWTDAEGRVPVDFPWDRLDPARPLAYASMGTLQNQVMQAFRTIAEAAAGTGLQLVISLGGGQDPSLLGDLPGDPIVVGYAPQLDLIARSALTISHGGLNTVLESLARGVPMVVLPVTNDQPGVGSRVEHAGVGRSIPIGRATVGRLREALLAVLGEPSYRGRAGALRSAIEAADGLDRAADLVEAAFDGRVATEPAATRRS